MLIPLIFCVFLVKAQALRLLLIIQSNGNTILMAVDGMILPLQVMSFVLSLPQYGRMVLIVQIELQKQEVSLLIMIAVQQMDLVVLVIMTSAQVADSAKLNLPSKYVVLM